MSLPGNFQPDAGYWNIEGVAVVLRGDEWQELLEAVIPDAADRLSYKAGAGGPKLDKWVTKQMQRRLVELAHANPESFRRKYVYRQAYGATSGPLLRMLLDAYASKIGLAQLIGDIDGLEPDEIVPSPLAVLGSNPICINLYGRKILSSLKSEPIGRVWIELANLSSVVGSVENFCLTTTSLSIRFTEKRVIVSESGRAAAEADRASTQRFLADLSYVIESIATDTLGEAKHELARLLERLVNRDYLVADVDFAVKNLRSAQLKLESGGTRYAAIDLGRVSRHIRDSLFV